MFQRVMSQIAAVKKDMVILEKSEFSTLLAENEVSTSFTGSSLVHRYPQSFNRFKLSAEAQDPDPTAPGSAGCRCYSAIQFKTLVSLDPFVYCSHGICVAGHDEQSSLCYSPGFEFGEEPC